MIHYGRCRSSRWVCSFVTSHFSIFLLFKSFNHSTTTTSAQPFNNTNNDVIASQLMETESFLAQERQQVVRVTHQASGFQVILLLLCQVYYVFIQKHLSVYNIYVSWFLFFIFFSIATKRTIATVRATNATASQKSTSVPNGPNRKTDGFSSRVKIGRKSTRHSIGRGQGSSRSAWKGLGCL